MSSESNITREQWLERIAIVDRRAQMAEANNAVIHDSVDAYREKHPQSYAELGWLDTAVAIIANASDLLAALESLFSNKHVNLGDLVYHVRERELQGWDGPSVKQWSDAVMAAKAAIAKAKGASQ